MFTPSSKPVVQPQHPSSNPNAALPVGTSSGVHVVRLGEAGPAMAQFLGGTGILGPLGRGAFEGPALV
jgi:hypothetical protein